MQGCGTALLQVGTLHARRQICGSSRPRRERKPASGFGRSSTAVCAHLQPFCRFGGRTKNGQERVQELSTRCRIVSDWRVLGTEGELGLGTEGESPPSATTVGSPGWSSGGSGTVSVLETVEQPAIARLVAQATTPIVSRFLFEESFFLIGGGVAHLRHKAKNIDSILLIFSNTTIGMLRRFMETLGPLGFLKQRARSQWI